jgi:Xaa-Pro aminopeptidase
MVMPTSSLISEQRSVQHAAKEVLQELAETIGARDTEQSIAALATDAMRRRKIEETWYHNCPALVLLGSRSCSSIGGKHYRPVLECVGEMNLVTVDLSPRRGEYCGDCARSFFIEGGRVTRNPRYTEFIAGAAFLQQLHAAMRLFVRPQTTFHDLAVWSAEQISAGGFENLDFRRNVGHSIARDRADRLYIEMENHVQLGDVDFFTFEPHVRVAGKSWGFKHEDIFFFDAEGRLEEL